MPTESGDPRGWVNHLVATIFSLVLRLGPLPPAGLPVHANELPRQPSASEVARLYTVVGRELSALEAKKGNAAAIDLWPRYRWIRINDALVSLPMRTESYQMLERLRREITDAER